MGFVKVTEASEVPSGRSKKVEHDGRAILVANVEGSFCAISGACTHMKGDLSEGTVEGGIVTCPRHGAKFDLRTGANVQGAKLLWWKVRVKDVRSFPVKVEGSDVLVDVG